MIDCQENIKKWLEGNRPFSVQEAESDRISRNVLAGLVRQGRLSRVERGIYLPENAMMTENYSFQVASLKVPHGVICLLSALRFHHITTQLPSEVWLAIRQHSRIPVMNNPRARFVMLSENYYDYGIEEHNMDGVKVRVYSAAKTVADCFRFRNQIGLDVAMEALREGIRRKLFTISELMNAAKVCRTAKIITPYAESFFS